ncbi:MAG: hypothetical protein KJ727_06650 [Acidobacteria bacterium]|nr:hypothetical protein [Acidobacteriota bacterium]MBU4254260.1 hypothetical protein [Acidobacteriota bacterium]MBU4331343.1 hypothetical protein [Acidobacteriota bacterium]MBU4496212.1 hypothetical protein [Acidobacteriota bacterium]MCG2814371.1 hypothetical protein [Candidatus Aminicenantes bacterium]
MLKRMNKKEGIRLLTGVLFFGSVWGMIEVFLGGFLYKQDIPRSSVFLAAGALFVLSAARIWMPRRGSSTLIGVVAALYKLINAAPFICHLFGIFALGFVFDAAASLFLKEKTRIKMGTILLGPVSVLVSNLFFAVFMTYIVRYFFWVEGGLGKVLNHTFISGGMTALLSLLIVPGTILWARRAKSGSLSQWKFGFEVVVAAVLLFWVIGWINHAGFLF